MDLRCPDCLTVNQEGSRFCRNCATPLPLETGGKPAGTSTPTYPSPREALTPGAEFAGRYLVIEEIGGGGMGRVYKVLDKEINEKVALKLIRPEFAAEPETIERFQNEIKIARKITHKNVGRVFHFSKHNETYYITMEFIPGQNLKTMIRMSKELSLEAALSIARQVCLGLAEAHRLGIIHRDLKPQNIMIDEQGTARIMDFGIASSVETSGATLPGAMLGTPDYISPEQVEGTPADERSDIYSVGVVLYEMLTGRPPFSGETSWAVLHKHATEIPADPRQINPEVPESMSRVVLKCLEKKKDRRYRTVEELEADLKRVEDEHVLVETRLRSGVTPAVRKPLFHRPARKTAARGLAAVGVISLVILAAICGRRLFRGAGPVPSQDKVKMAVITFENQTGDTAYDYLRDAIPNLLITSLEQSDDIRMTSWERLRDLLKQNGKGDRVVIDRDLGFELCRQEGVQAIVLGSYVKAGDTFATDIKVLDVRTKGILLSSSSRGEGVDSILKRQIDDLSRDIARGLIQPEGVTQAAASPIAEVTTVSMEAYHHFLRGRDDYEKFYLAEAQKSLERAIELDPDFAMAHYYLAWVHLRMGNGEAARQSLAKLRQFGDRVVGKEGLYIRALLAQMSERNPEKYVATLRKIIADFPDEKRARLDLGTYFLFAERPEEALAELREAVKLDPQYGYAMNILAYTYARLQKYDQAIEWFKKYALVSPTEANPHDSLGDVYFNIGEFEKALGKYEEALRIKPDFASGYKISYIQALRGDYDQAMIWADRHIAAVPSNADKAWASLLKAVYFHMQGRHSQSITSLDEAQKYAAIDGALGAIDNVYRTRLWIAWEWRDHDLFIKTAKERFDFRAAQKYLTEEINRFIYEYYQGLFDLKRKGSAAARERLAALEKLRPASNLPQDAEVWTTGVEHLRAEILLAEGRPEDALLAYEKIKRTPITIIEAVILVQRNVPHIRDIRGKAYTMQGKTDLAVSFYESFVSSDPRAREMELLHPFSRLELAKLYEATGERDKAIAELERLAELWKDADQGLAEVEEAKRLLATLRGGKG